MSWIMINRVPKMLVFAAVLIAASGPEAEAEDKTKSTKPTATVPKKIVLIAGKKSHGPGHHEYEQGMRLVKACLESSPNVTGVQAEVHLNGWPDDPQTLDDADTIVVFSDGSDHDVAAHPLLHGDRLKILGKQMARGCGFVALHYTVFVPIERGGPEFLNWLGGHFDYETGAGPRKWFSKIRTAKTTPKPASPKHPICRGMQPFPLREEYYYNIRFRPGDGRFRPGDGRFTPILTTSIPGESAEQIVAWAVEREDGGRGFGFTGGHFHDNWQVDQFRRMILGAILWTAKADVPAGGVKSQVPDEQTLSGVTTGRPIRTLILTGHQYPGHKWKQTTPALRDALRGDPRMEIRVAEDAEFLADPALHTFDTVVMNYCNWKRPGLSAEAKANFVRFIKQGGGLSIIHFANGAFHFSLPEAGDSDWPLWRKQICRRTWDHTPGKSGHDAYGPFVVEIANKTHPVTAGMQPYQTTDELYFRQQGDQPIEVLATARSNKTGQNEPMAFVYNFGKGRVFQTVLGHDEASLRVPGTAALVRRGAVWTAGRDQRKKVAAVVPASPVPKTALVEGRFGQALNAKVSSVEVASRKAYVGPPLTVECWAKIDSKTGFNILVAQSPKSSADHWELYTYAGTGVLSAFFPGHEPAEIKSDVNVTDGRWHHLAMTYSREAHVELFVDGRRVKQADLKRQRTGGPSGPLWLGAYPPNSIECDGLIDEVRISSIVRDVAEIPTEPLANDEQTVGLWRFDKSEVKRIEDVSGLKNPAVLRQATSATGNASDLSVTYRTADPELKVVKLDFSPDDSFLSVRADTMGRLFVGCREALFVYEPDTKGSYAPRKLLYRFPPDTWVNDVEIRGNDLYCMTPSALYVFPNGRTEHENLQPKRLVWGTPVDLHVTYHGLAWGPEGDLYFASGDPLLTYGDFKNRPDHWGHWTVHTQPEGTDIPFTGTGGFYRCRPDGSAFQVVAQGTRGSCGLASDRHWNLFSNDNDHESMPAEYVPGRLLHVTPKAHFFWPRGWMASKTPERADLLQTMCTQMGRSVPVGQSYYDESFLPKRYRNNLLVARWGQRRIDRYPIEPRGASFQAAEHPLLICSGAGRPVGVTVGRGGRIFATVSHMQANAYSPKYPSDLIMITRADDEEGHPFEPYDAVTAGPERHWSELSNDSWCRRQRAHVEILRRGGPLLHEAVERLIRCPAKDPAISHLLWLAGLSGEPAAVEKLRELARHHDAAIRLQAVRVLAECTEPGAEHELFVSTLSDEDPRIRHAALIALFVHGDEVSQSVLDGLARSEDTYLRQAAAFLVAEKGTSEQILALFAAEDAAGRLAGILAAGFRLTVPTCLSMPSDELRLNVRRTGGVWDAKTVVQYADAKIDLAKLARIGSYTTAQWWTLARKEAAHRKLYELLIEALADPRVENRLQAAYFLSLLNDARAQPLVDKVRRDNVARQLAAQPLQQVKQAWVIGPFGGDENSQQTAALIASGPIDLSGQYGAAERRLKWESLSVDRSFSLVN
jgi:type 1 glutamine amidotransferase